MLTSEFVSWQRYARQRGGLPSHRLQSQVALLAYLIVNMLGDGSNEVGLESFMIGGETKEEEVRSPQQAAGSAFAGAGSKGVVKLGQRKRARKK